MAKKMPIILLLIVLSLGYFMLQSMMIGGQLGSLSVAANGAPDAHLPAVFAPVPAAPTATATRQPSPEAQLLNGSFEEGWTDVSNRVQKPNDWALYQIPEGEPLFDSTDLASGTCECKHLLNNQLPDDQKFGGKDALILDGGTVYKLFGVYQSWGTELSQTVDGLAPGSTWRLTLPIRVHLHEDPGEWGAESSLWVNDLGYWANGFQMGDQEWCKHQQLFVVPEDGKADIAIRVKAKWPLSKDFFTDDILLQPASDPAPHQELPFCRENPSIITYQPIKTRK